MIVTKPVLSFRKGSDDNNQQARDLSNLDLGTTVRIQHLAHDRGKSKSGREIALSLIPSKDGGWKSTAQEQKAPSSNERNVKRNRPV